MRYFFKVLVEEGQLGYLLFFNEKPMCSYGAILQSDLPYALRSRVANLTTYSNKRFIKGWQVWRTHAAQSLHSDFIYSEEVSQEQVGEGTITFLGVYFFNKKAIQKCFEQYGTLFKERLGEGFSCEVLLARLEQHEGIHAIVEHDAVLLGLLYGYGKESALAFEQGRDLVGVGTSKIDKSRISPVVWGGELSSEETRHLTELYEQELRELSKMYWRKDRLEISMKRLCIQK